MTETVTVEKEVYESVLRVNCNKIAECELLQKQLDIAVNALEKYATKEGVIIEQRARYVVVDYHPFYDEGKLAKHALKEIEELNR